MTEEKDETQKTGLKPAQVVASALAAITAAFLGSTLGVGGTVAGAGVASIITTIGGEVYLRSLRRTKDAARKTAEVLALTDTRLRQETRFVEPPPPTPANPLMQPGPPPTRQAQLPPTELRTQRLPMAGAGQSGNGERTVYIPRPGAPNSASAATQVLARPETKPKPPWWKNRWTLIAATSVAAFVIGMLALTGFEGLTGHAVSGGSGTTFSKVVGNSGGATTTHETTTVTDTQTSESRSTATSTEDSATSTSPTSTQDEQQPSQSSASQSASATPTQSASPTSG